MKRLGYTILFYLAMSCGIAHADTLDIVVTGDDYTDSTQFQLDAQRVQAQLMSLEPYHSRPTDLTWRYVFTTKDLDCHPQLTVSRLIMCSEMAIQSVLQGITYDKVFVLINSPNYGGYGGPWYATCYNGDLGPMVCAHEFGHTLGQLHDEYVLFGTGVVSEKLDKNCYQSPNDPIHYPYLGCTYQNWSRQYSDCLMKGLNGGYCPLCQQLLNAKIDGFVTGASTSSKGKGKGHH